MVKVLIHHGGSAFIDAIMVDELVDNWRIDLPVMQELKASEVGG